MPQVEFIGKCRRSLASRELLTSVEHLGAQGTPVREFAPRDCQHKFHTCLFESVSVQHHWSTNPVTVAATSDVHATWPGSAGTVENDFENESGSERESDSDWESD